MANPFALVIADGSGSTWIDLDQPGWMKVHAELMRAPGQWSLIEKPTARVVLTMLVASGEQPYYTARHVGLIGSGGSNEVVAHGIGKKRLDGHVDRMWILPNGIICAGDDLEPLAIQMVKAAGPRGGRISS